jgi:TetR/AcrR family transcriptional regulator, transcriptional repressor for nem operon
VRYPPDQKVKAREAMLKAGARELKSNGFNGIGVDGLASAAGVTSGAFYSNFRSKEAMLEAVIDAGLGEPLLSDTDAVSIEEGRAALTSFLREYINVDHSADPAEGCVMPALSADVSHAHPSVKETYERKMSALVARIASLLDGDESDRLRRAWSVVAIMVGAVLVARSLPVRSELQRAVIDSALITALALIDVGTGDG